MNLQRYTRYVYCFGIATMYSFVIVPFVQPALLDGEFLNGIDLFDKKPFIGKEMIKTIFVQIVQL